MIDPKAWSNFKWTRPEIGTMNTTDWFAQWHEYSSEHDSRGNVLFRKEEYAVQIHSIKQTWVIP